MLEQILLTYFSNVFRGCFVMFSGRLPFHTRLVKSKNVMYCILFCLLTQLIYLYLIDSTNKTRDEIYNL